MSLETAYSCCCNEQPPSTTYWAEPCNPQPGYCCPQDCVPYATIAYCPGYLLSIGIPVPPVVGRCYIIREGCCYYKLSYETSQDCNAVIGPKNIGVLVEAYDPSEERSCCEEPVDPPQPPGNCLYNFCFGTEYFYQPAVCTQIVTQDYQFSDQRGTVKGREPTVISSHSPCYETFGASMSTYADNCPPIAHSNAPVINLSQKVGECIPTDLISSCAGQRTYINAAYLTCSECNPCGAYCPTCSGSDDPCEGIPPNDPYCPDPARFYSARTCYSVENCLDSEDQQVYQEEHVFDIIFSLCNPIDTGNPAAVAAAKAWALAQVTLTYYSRATDIGSIQSVVLSACDVDVDILSGNAVSIVAAFKQAAGGTNTAVDAEAVTGDWKTYMWFGTRQTCTCCCTSTASGCANSGGCSEPYFTRPPYNEADVLIIKDAVVPNSTTVRVRMFGKSPYKYICACQSVTLLYAGTAAAGSTTCAISRDYGTGNQYAIGCISIAEYSRGDRYTMGRVEDSLTTTFICTKGNPSDEVPLCDYVAGYPYEDKYVGGVLVAKGFETLCTQMDTPCSKYCSYPFEYSVIPCCPSADCSYCSSVYYPNTPTYVPCPNSGPLVAYQSEGYNCCTITGDIQVL